MRPLPRLEYEALSGRINLSGGQKGFTLLEVLIGMTLLTIIMLLLFSAFRTGVRSWDAGEQRAVETNNILIVQSFLRSRLMNAQPLADDFSDTEAKFSFIGTKESLQFVSAFSARDGLTKFNVFFDNQDDGSLKITAVPFFPTFDEAFTEPDALVLFESVDQIEFSYFGSESVGHDPEWSDGWEDRNSLPNLVKLKIRFQNKAEITWPTMMVRLRIEKQQG